jgi:hypothetical protein
MHNETQDEEDYKDNQENPGQPTQGFSDTREAKYRCYNG